MPPYNGKALTGAVLAASLSLAGCSFRERGLADRCADVLRQAWPGRIEVTGQQANLDFANDLTHARASAAGTVKGLAGGPREVAIECAFHENILTGFRWTAGQGDAVRSK